jgi:hypothetical protein
MDESPSLNSVAALENLYLELLRDRDAVLNGISETGDEAARAKMTAALGKLELLLANVSERLDAARKEEGQI